MQGTLDLFMSKINMPIAILWTWSYLEHHSFMSLQTIFLSLEVKVGTSCSGQLQRWATGSFESLLVGIGQKYACDSEQSAVQQIEFFYCLLLI